MATSSQVQLLPTLPTSLITDLQQKTYHLDQRYIDTQRKVTEELWPFLKTAINVYQTVEDTTLHNSLFCHPEAEGYSTVEGLHELQCYCRRVAYLFQTFGVRADFHDRMVKSRKRKSVASQNPQSQWVYLLESLKDADEESWCLAYRDRYKFPSGDQELKEAMADFHQEIFNELQDDDDLSVSETAETADSGPEEEKAYLKAREIDRDLDRMVQEDIQRAMEREEKAVLDARIAPGSTRGKRVSKKPIKYKE